MAEIILKTTPPTEIVSISETKVEEHKKHDNYAIEEKKEIDLRPYDPLVKLMFSLMIEFSELVGNEPEKVQLGFAKRIEMLKTELDPKTPLEELLVERIMVCWLESHLIDLHICAVSDVKVKNLYLKRQMSAHKRYLSAIKSLAQLRKLEVSQVQVDFSAKIGCVSR